jgi:hypothetical protein
MDWKKLDLGGRMTAMRESVCAGVTPDGTAVIALLGDHDPPVVTVDPLALDSCGVVGVSAGDRTWLTGRGQDGRLHLWGVTGPDEPDFVSGQALDGLDAMWAVPVLDARAALVLTAYAGDGGWRLRAHTLAEARAGRAPRGGELCLAGPPDAHVSYAFRQSGPVVVAGAIGEGPAPAAAAWAVQKDHNDVFAGLGWRRVLLAPTPCQLSSVSAGRAGRRTWIAGRRHDEPVIFELLDLPFRGPLRTTAVPMPAITLAPEAVEGPARPVVVVDGAYADRPVFVAATTKGNRVCWLDGSTWKAHPVPDGHLHAASTVGGRIHVLLDGAVWSMADPAAA